MFTALRLTSTSLPVAARSLGASVQARALSGKGIAAAEKLRSALEEYRLQNYTQEVPSRFKKDILKAAIIPVGSSKESVVAMDSLQRVLANIHMGHRLTQREMQSLFEELGNGKVIPAESIIKFI